LERSGDPQISPTRHFKHARFSNDLDFSTQTEITGGGVLEGLSQACAFAGERRGVEFLVDESRILERTMADRTLRHAGLESAVALR
jgi:predicted nucleotidyltransferase component of viral defense system